MYALHSHLAEHGAIAPKGTVRVARLTAGMDDDDLQISDIVRDTARTNLEQIDALDGRILEMEDQLRGLAKASDKVRRLRTMPGGGPRQR